MTQKSSTVSEILTVGISRAKTFNEVNSAMQISTASEIQIMQARFWKCVLHCFFLSHHPPYLSFLSSTSKNQLEETASSLNLASFQEAQNFICDAGKISLHGKGPNGKSNDSIFPKESCHLRPCPYRRSSEQLIPCIKCVCACIWWHDTMLCDSSFYSGSFKWQIKWFL